MAQSYFMSYFECLASYPYSFYGFSSLFVVASSIFFESWQNRKEKCSQITQTKTSTGYCNIIKDIFLSQLGPNKLNIPSTGVEIEVDFINEAGGRSTVEDLSSYEGKGWNGQPEIHPQTLELGTVKGHKINDSVRLISRSLKFALDNRKNRDIFPFGSLPHPFTLDDEANFSKFIEAHQDPYYQVLTFRRDGYCIRNLDVNGVQFHVDSDNPDILLKRYNYLRWFIPFFFAFSMSSPIRGGAFRGYWSERLKVKGDLPLSGTPPVISSLEGLNTCLKTEEGIPFSHAPGYYWLRLPRFDICTTEMCAGDMTPDINTIFALLDIYHRVSQKIDRSTLDEMPENIFGMKAMQLAPETSVLIDRSLQNIVNARSSIKDSEIYLSGEIVSFPKWVERILTYVDDVPSEISISNFSAEKILRDTIEMGTVSERILATLQADGIILPGDNFGRIVHLNNQQLEHVYSVYKKIVEDLLVKNIRDYLI